jgi:hypothetical protein
VGVLGDIEAGGKKALFLRTYTKDVLLFLTDETTIDEKARKKLDEENVRILTNLKQIKRATESTVAIVTESGETQEVNALYPALGCTGRSDLAQALGASCTDLDPIGWENDGMEALGNGGEQRSRAGATLAGSDEGGRRAAENPWGLDIARAL